MVSRQLHWTRHQVIHRQDLPLEVCLYCLLGQNLHLEACRYNPLGQDRQEARLLVHLEVVVVLPVEAPLRLTISTFFVVDTRPIPMVL